MPPAVSVDMHIDVQKRFLHGLRRAYGYDAHARSYHLAGKFLEVRHADLEDAEWAKLAQAGQGAFSEHVAEVLRRLYR